LKIRDTINPGHYKDGEIECIDAMEACSTRDEFVGYLRLNAMKYIWRMGRKTDDVGEEVEKSLWYLRKLLTFLESERNVENIDEEASYEFRVEEERIKIKKYD
jgi:hypothetical protein